MDETNVPEQDPWAEIAAELHRIAYDAATLVGKPVAPHFELNIQPWSADDYRGVTVKNRAATIASVDAVALALLGKPARTDKLSDGTFFHKVGGRRGRVSFSIYQSVADPALIDKDEEIAQLRSRLAELEGDRRPLVDPDASMEAHYDAEVDAQSPHPSWPTEAELKPWESLQPSADRTADAMEPIDDLGDAFDRTQTADADETPVPVDSRRRESHAGDYVSGIADDGHHVGDPGQLAERGLVDETPTEATEAELLARDQAAYDRGEHDGHLRKADNSCWPSCPHESHSCGC